MEGWLSPPHSTLKPVPVNTLLITFIRIDVSYLLIKLEDDTRMVEKKNWMIDEDFLKP